MRRRRGRRGREADAVVLVEQPPRPSHRSVEGASHVDFGPVNEAGRRERERHPCTASVYPCPPDSTPPERETLQVGEENFTGWEEGAETVYSLPPNPRTSELPSIR